MKNIYLAVLLILASFALAVSCAPPELKPATSINYTPAVPISGFTTFTSEGLFSISYPQDWSLANSLLEELREVGIDLIEGIDPDIDLSDVQLLFMAGKETLEGYYPNVMISVTPRSIGYYNLDEICEAEERWAKEYLQGYEVNSQVRTVINGLEADITIDEDYEPEFGTWRYITVTIVKDDFVWFVGCSSESEDFPEYEDTFDKIVRSIRILN